jgi:sugar phosphate isomerase/epimerase
MHISRRSLLQGFCTAGACAMLDRPAIADTATNFFQRRGLPMGLQTYTLGEEAGKDIDATFAAVAAIGYRDIELPNLYGRKPAEIRQAAERAGLTISSLHVPFGRSGEAPGLSATGNPAEIAENLGALGATRAVMPIMLLPENFRPNAGEGFAAAITRGVAAAGADLWKQTAAVLNERGAALKPAGIRVGYHNHNFEFAPIGETTGWDILVAETDPELVSFEVDTGWVATAGLDPVAFFEPLKGRVAQLHVKDVAASNHANFALSMQPAEVGAGTLDWARLLPAAHAAGARHFYVEQEPPFAIPRMESIRRSYAYLSKLRA